MRVRGGTWRAERRGEERSLRCPGVGAGASVEQHDKSGGQTLQWSCITLKQWEKSSESRKYFQRLNKVI